MGNLANCCTNRERAPMTDQDIQILTTAQLSLSEVQRSLSYIQRYFEESNDNEYHIFR
jgi:hypothetical protein